MNSIDNFLNRITMYRLVLYVLIGLLVAALLLSMFGKLPYSPQAILFSTFVLTAASLVFNKLFAWFMGVPANAESDFITALILALIISPPTGALTSDIWFLIWAAVLAQVSKYVINIKNKHIFNPAAAAVAITAVAVQHSASWWVGTLAMLPFTTAGGFLMVRKLRRWDTVLAFLAAALAATIALSSGMGAAALAAERIIISSPLLFFASIMLTEPLTMPHTKDGRIAYGILVGWMFAPQTHIGSFYFTPELALLCGNLFAYLVSPKQRLVLRLKEKIRAGSGVYDFIFHLEQKLNFHPGQYMEWTLGHKHADSRGHRRYFTIASSPTEPNVRLGVKFYEQPSSFKRHLLALQPGETVIASQLAGDFILPKNKNKKLAFVAGGIGITPFRSILKYLVDKKERRDIVLVYAARSSDEIVYQDVLGQAKDLGVKLVGVLSNPHPSEQWHGYTGYVSAGIIKTEIPDFKERAFYISGSHTMVESVKQVLEASGVPRRHIKTDFFPGLA